MPEVEHGESESDYVRRLDESSPPPTSRADAVCRCTYRGIEREYRCIACRSGFGPDRPRIGGVITLAVSPEVMRAEAERCVREALERERDELRRQRTAAARQAPRWRRWLAVRRASR